MEPDDALPASPCPRTAAPHLADDTGRRRCTVIRPDDARSTTRISSYNYNAGDDDDSLAGLDVLYHNRMVQAMHQQARRDMATQTEETIVAPGLAGAAEAFFDRDGGGGCRATPASVEAIARLEKRRYDGDGDDAAAARCAICIEDFEVGDELSVMPCAHGFHKGCIAKWLERSRLCPCCRHALPLVPASGV
ncbi:unnamed protein product [Urochloa decumbens]|uniref:RING-type domain-containing protein n=1 Tax=Urochloa decumbens TaxID=240449 RepID=A0ABC9H2E1_9POAL